MAIAFRWSCRILAARRTFIRRAAFVVLPVSLGFDSQALQGRQLSESPILSSKDDLLAAIALSPARRVSSLGGASIPTDI